MTLTVRGLELLMLHITDDDGAGIEADHEPCGDVAMGFVPGWVEGE